ncbi:UBX domain-containing protein 4 isoform X1 [Trichogramma pretiosum]|uniref:UBX domain-containing protein 4 isoform X1 n=1 Tax=Trichogramma pretiosum TaxID=7493 RepID=UPI0006C9DC60|nr:UBX domain-containing protein 4 isoform X1 [Trichogramma pretiosum]
MKWFQGSIAEAVNASKAKKAVFVVFVEGKDDTSKRVAESIDSPQVSSKLESEDFVAIKLQSDTENYTFFAQIYQLVPVPSIFFIGDNGAPLEVVGHAMSPDDLAAKISSILEKAKPEISQSSANLIQAEQLVHSSFRSNTLPDSSKTLPQTVQNPSPLSSSSNQTAEPSTSVENSEDISQEEKVRRARQLIYLQQKQKEQEEKEKEKEREMERRRMGKDVLKMRQMQQDKELREAQEERLKEKAADAAAREKILKQIAEDKLERKKKYEMHIKEKEAQQEKIDEERQARLQAQAPSVDMSKARIQFKLPTGSNITGTFEATETLGTLRAYVTQNAQLPFRHFSMSSFFPRRDFTSADDSKTLSEMELVPSATILILPLKSSNTASVIKSSDGAGIFSHFFWTLVAPVISIYNYISSYFTGNRGGGNNSGNSGNAAAGPSSSSGFRGFPPAARRLGGTSKIRTRGNIRTLHSGDNDDDENNTWNGNSTQQM